MEIPAWWSWSARSARRPVIEGGQAREAALRSAGSSVRTLADPKMSSTTSRDCLPGRKGRNGSTSSLFFCQKIRSASVKKGASDCGGIDDAQEMNAAARSGTIHRLRPASAGLSAASLPASTLCAATWRQSMAARCLDQRYLRKGAIFAQNNTQRVLRIRKMVNGMETRAARDILSTLAMAVTSATGLVGREAPKNN